MTKTAVRKTVALLTVLMLVIITVFASECSFADSYDYTTEKFNVNVIAKENNEYLFTERITVKFNGEHHGIFRNIPQDYGKMKINDISVENEDYETYTEDGNYVIKIGNKRKYLTGVHTYTIKYRMRVYDDKNKGSDLLYLDLIPTYWETPIKSVHATLTMPKKLDWDNLEVFSGNYGTTDNGNAEYSIDKQANKITVTGTDMLRGQGVTVKSTLPEGYWVNPLDNDWAKLPLAVLIIAIPILVLLMWIKFGRDPKVVKTVEFYPPDGMTPAELGYVIDGSVENNDIVSLIIYFASKGYLTITEYKKNKFELEKKMEIPSSEKKFAQTLFDGLFEKSNTVRLDELDSDFGETFLAAKEELYSYFRENKSVRAFSISSAVARIFAGILLLLLATGGVALGALYSLEYIYLIAAVPVFLCTAGAFVLLMIAYDRRQSMKAASKAILRTVGVILAAVALIISIAVTVVKVESAVYAIGIGVAETVTFILAILMRARTKKGAELQGRILGFKNFIKKAELSKLKMLVEEDPEYFYNILPYAYVMGLSDKWAKNFEKIPTKAPSWYYGSNPNTMFNVIWFSSMINSCGRNFSNNIKIPTGDSGFSGGSGGGFSGGGFGGGGGGAW